MKLVFISDTHNYLGKMKIPNGDVLCIAGDVTGVGNVNEVAIFGNQLKGLKNQFKYIIFIAGNHDWLFQKDPLLARELCKGENIHYLENSGIELEGVIFWGSPYTPEFLNWAFSYPKGEGWKHWGQIPKNIDVLITHGMPYGILDKTFYGEHVGCPELLHHIKKIKPKIYCGGHLHHEGGRVVEIEGTKFVNAAICTDEYKPERLPVQIELWKNR